jgi:hypothetical protein
MKRIGLLLLLLCAATQLHAQYAPVDSLGRDTRNLIEGQRRIHTGQNMLLAGGIATAAGGALLAVPFFSHSSQITEDGQTREDMVSPIFLVTGGAIAAAGVLTALCSIPVIVSGHGILASDTYWRNNAYDNPAQRGFGVILDAGGFLKGVEMKATAGYHFNRNLFLGAGLGLAYDLEARRNEDLSTLKLPVFANLRYSTSNRLCSPFVGVSGGYDVLDDGPYLGADLGLRVRMDTRKPTSLWTSLYGDVSASYMHFGLKFGWAF